MIKANAATQTLVAKLKAQGKALGEQRGRQIASNFKTGPVNWRNPATLWPEFYRED